MKKRIILLMVAISLFTGCSNKESNINNKEEDKIVINNIEEQEQENITVFNALGKTYESTKDILALNEGDKIYSNREENPYTRGEYKEVDFASDLVVEYLAKNQEVYNCLVSEWDKNSEEAQLISGEEKERVKEEVNFLGEQFNLGEEDPIYFRLDKVIMNEKLEGEGAVTLEIRGHISKTNGNFKSIGNFFVTVYTKGDKLYASII